MSIQTVGKQTGLNRP